jgi:hypothetical protein
MAVLKIPREALESSNISSAGYDSQRQILAIEFKGGAVFHYAPFTLEQLGAFYSAESKGKFYAQHIRGKIAGEKMTGDCPKCGDKNGWLGETCTDCGCAVYADTRAAKEQGR